MVIVKALGRFFYSVEPYKSFEKNYNKLKGKEAHYFVFPSPSSSLFRVKTFSKHFQSLTLPPSFLPLALLFPSFLPSSLPSLLPSFPFFLPPPFVPSSLTSLLPSFLPPFPPPFFSFLLLPSYLPPSFSLL